jgi:hypothetical protein
MVFVKIFNDTFRDYLLDVEIFHSLREAKFINGE